MGRGNGIQANGASLLFGSRSAKEPRNKQDILKEEQSNLDKLTKQKQLKASIKHHEDQGGKVEFYEATGVDNSDPIIEMWTNRENKLHRSDGPAVAFHHGRREWRVQGKLHRVEGPAVEGDGDEYWLEGMKMTAEKHDEYRHLYE